MPECMATIFKFNLRHLLPLGYSKEWQVMLQHVSNMFYVMVFLAMIPVSKTHGWLRQNARGGR
jgi:hypothetical protein